MKSVIVLWLLILAITSNAQSLQTATNSDLHTLQLASRWDEAMPLGNAWLGALVWQKGHNLRLSLDRADLWDLRPMKGIDRPEFSYKWVEQQVLKKDYKIVQDYFDKPYDTEPGPTKIPGAALEFDTKSFGKITSAHLFIKQALCEVRWENGVVLKTFVHANRQVGWFRFEQLPTSVEPQLVPPTYNLQSTESVSNTVTEGGNLLRLGYQQGQVDKGNNYLLYKQKGRGGFTYEVVVKWVKKGTTLAGTWNISSHYPEKKTYSAEVTQFATQALQRGFDKDFATHSQWWAHFWKQSSVQVPDPVLQKQYDLELYKFGSAARADAPPISLQAIWTADNGRIPPWKGDYHHDLNTQLSYWLCYAGNHLGEGLGYLNHLDSNLPNYKNYTKRYFGTDGIAVPGVTTLTGVEMGGWIQYSLSPTVSAWLAQHYYLHWRYSMDRAFLKARAYPWVKGVATHLEQLTVKDANGKRKLPISASPEINDNDLSAWFLDNTNYDLSLMRFTFKTAAELANELGLSNESKHWQTLLSACGTYSITAQHELMFAPTLPYNQSHRHFSHLMAIHPLGEIKWENGPAEQQLIKATLKQLDAIGPDWWCGYSYAWLGSLKARAKDGAGAANALQTFATAFCLPNSFHVNGDQTKSGKSKFTYRPFTLEGNFAFAAGIHEMLLQSHAGFIDIFPAIPATWHSVSFDNLRAEGAFMVSAQQQEGSVTELKITSEKGGKTSIKLPANQLIVSSKNKATIRLTNDGFMEVSFQPSGVLVLKSKD